eukprot:UN24779
MQGMGYNNNNQVNQGPNDFRQHSSGPSVNDYGQGVISDNYAPSVNSERSHSHISGMQNEPDPGIYDSYQNQELRDVANLLNSNNMKQDSMNTHLARSYHQRQKSMENSMNYITNYLRSQDRILNARLLSIEDGMRRQFGGVTSVLQSIPAHSKQS